jgi:hypothetical protein
MFFSARDLGGRSRTADSRFICVVSVAHRGAGLVANLRVANLCLINRRVVFMDDYCVALRLSLSVVLSVVPAAIIVAAITIVPLAVIAIVVCTATVSSIGGGCYRKCTRRAKQRLRQ